MRTLLMLLLSLHVCPWPLVPFLLAKPEGPLSVIGTVVLSSVISEPTELLEGHVLHD
jgi:hypothetical protein